MIFFYFITVLFLCSSFSLSKPRSKIPKRKNSAVSSKLSTNNKMKVSSSSASSANQPLNKNEIASRQQRTSNANNQSQSKAIEQSRPSLTKLYNHHHQLSSGATVAAAAVAPPPSSSSSAAKSSGAVESTASQSRRLLDFITKQKAGAHDQRQRSTANDNGKLYSQPTTQKPLNGVRNGGNGVDNNRKKITNNAAQIDIKTRSNDKAAHPFVPSKRIIQHHDYQNLVDDTKTTAMAAAAAAVASTSITNRGRYADSCTYDSVVDCYNVDRNNNRKQYNDERTKAPIYRHFGDTNLMRANKCKQYNELNNNNNQQQQPKRTSTNANNNTTVELTMASFDKHHHHQKLIKYHPDVRQRINSNGIALANDPNRNDIYPNSYVTTNLTNDTGFASMEDAASIVTHKPTSKSSTSTKSNNFHLPFHCINYNVKNRIKMFDVDVPTPYRKHAANKIHHDKRYAHNFFSLSFFYFFVFFFYFFSFCLEIHIILRYAFFFLS